MKKLISFLKIIWNHKIISTIIIIVLIAGGFFGKRQFFPSTDGLEESVIKKGTVKEELILSGTITADEYAQLAFSSSGTIEWMGVKEGDKVTKGQALAKLDSISLNAAYQASRADLRAAEANVQKIHDDVKDHDKDETFTQKNTRTAAETAKDSAYEAVLIAEKNLKNATLRAPFTGIVSGIANPFSGINVSLSTPQIEVVNPDTIHFKITADQTEIINLKLDDKVEITLDALEGKILTGTVTYISYTPTSGEGGSVYGIKIKLDNFDNKDLTYRVGMTGDAKFILDQKDNVLYVPSSFIKNDKEGSYLLTNKGKTKTYVTIGIEGEENTEISADGINEGVVIYD